TVVVDDVHAFPGHIACDSASRSEIVIPLSRKGVLWGVLDIDSPVEARFGDAERTALEAAAREIEAALERCE
ncbi:MAG: GAF domain-containing protein, partial [Clostridia bacterium]|nr:GAF domain-containing protein [Clostridia bacterium]